MSEVIIKNVMRCGICQSPADRIGGPEKVYGHHNPNWYYRCQANPNHIADPFVAIFSDLSFPNIRKRQSGEQ